MGLIKNIIYSILSVEEQFLKKRLEKTIGIKSVTKRKRFFSNGCLLSFESLAEEEKNKMEEELRLILKQSDFIPENLLEYVKKQGTNVYYVNNPNLLYSVNENEGFIYPQNGLKALYLSFITKQGLKFKTDEMFVLSKGKINDFYFIYNLYNWYAFKHGISGTDSESLVMLNKYLFSANENDMKQLQLADIYKLKEAIKQDKASIEFVLKLCQDLDGVKNAFKKLTDEGTNI